MIWNERETEQVYETEKLLLLFSLPVFPALDMSMLIAFLGHRELITEGKHSNV